MAQLLYLVVSVEPCFSEQRAAVAFFFSSILGDAHVHSSR